MSEKINHLHFPTLASTQTTLLALYEAKQTTHPALVTTDNQTHGSGRGENRWDHLENSLALSFTIQLQKELLSYSTLLPLGVGVALCEIFLKLFHKKIFLKWPNDLLNEKKEKLGGIICQHQSDENIFIVGVGINLGQSKIANHYSYKAHHVLDQQFTKEELRKISLSIYQHILTTDCLKENFVQKGFKQHCLHLNKDVTLIENGDETSGKFIGIDPYGFALLLEKETQKIKTFSNGSIRLNR